MEKLINTSVEFMCLINKIGTFLFVRTKASKEAQRLAAEYGANEAVAQACRNLVFAADYGAPGEMEYWESVLRSLANAQKPQKDGSGV